MAVDLLSCSPVQLIEDLAASMRIRAQQKGISLSVEYTSPLPSEIVTDPVRFRQIVVNLVGNAIKFTEVGGVRIVAGVRQLERDQPMLEVNVIDTGAGLTKHQCRAVFEAFYQVDGSRTRRHTGTGLGLTISRSLCELLGGSLHLSSQPGQGSTFTARFPLKSSNKAHAGPAPPSKAGTPAASRANGEHTRTRLPQLPHCCRVLLVEDGPDTQRLVSAVLRTAGAEVVIAQNGQEALDAVLTSTGNDAGSDPSGSHSFDLILMDMQMPVMDGLEATRHLRTIGFRKPIIALTAHPAEQERQAAISAGCTDFMCKPFTPSALLQLVAGAIRN